MLKILLRRNCFELLADVKQWFDADLILNYS